jgi:ACT domain-containing protein
VTIANVLTIVHGPVRFHGWTARPVRLAFKGNEEKKKGDYSNENKKLQQKAYIKQKNRSKLRQ